MESLHRPVDACTASSTLFSFITYPCLTDSLPIFCSLDDCNNVLTTMSSIALARAYQQSFEHHPYGTLAVTNGALNALGDLVAQLTERHVRASLASCVEHSSNDAPRPDRPSQRGVEVRHPAHPSLLCLRVRNGCVVCSTRT